MDPISLAVGIVPLSDQLIKTIKTIKKLIATYKSATKELETLVSKLNHVEIICESIGAVLSAACLSDNHPSSARLPSSLYEMIHECYEKVTDIHRIIQSVTEKRDRGGGLFRNEGLLFLQNKDKITAGVKNLDKSLDVLQLLLTTIIFSMRTPYPPMTRVNMPSGINPPQQTCAVMAPIPTVDSIDTSPISTDAPTQPKHVEPVTKMWRRSFLQLAFLQKSHKRNITAGTSGSDSLLIEDSSILTAGSTWFNCYIKLSLKKDHLTPLSDSLGTRIREAFKEDNVDVVQQLFNERTITPATQITWNEYDPDRECNLLGLAAIARAPRILEFIRHQMRRVEETAHFGGCMWRCYRIRTQSQLQSAITYINIRKNALNIEELHMLLAGTQGFRQLKACMDAYLSWRPVRSPESNQIIQNQLIDIFRKENLDVDLNMDDCVAVVSGLIDGGLDLSKGYNFDPSSLTQILRCRRTSDEAVESLHRWLDMLELAGVDIEAYLQFERPRCLVTWNESSANWHMPLRGKDSYIKRTLQVGYSRGRLIPYWRENIDKSCLVHELLMEFPHFLHSETIDIWTNAEQTMRYHRAWKSGKDLELLGPEKRSWPVAPLLVAEQSPDDPVLAADINEEYKIALEWTERAYHLMESRFERKQNLKMQKRAGKGKSCCQLTLPGSWVD
ncbi:hypothetical protein FPOAC1_005297 [Fusarium poae]|uniref:hypothetical protein n=1 Tax=Fusarium poae TaxID=36050 RepID=UPI001CEBAE8E|nr:hypothetical protein FPOAC1_005297 [Fusarium poae]KAG8672037.1 hypothetical protein FPOAC1_005297 [Fusarium poae]